MLPFTLGKFIKTEPIRGTRFSQCDSIPTLLLIKVLYKGFNLKKYYCCKYTTGYLRIYGFRWAKPRAEAQLSTSISKMGKEELTQSLSCPHYE